MLDMSWHPWYDNYNNQKQMTATFADYVAEQDARNTIQLKVTEWCLMLCDALTHAAPEGYDYIIESGRKYHKIIMVDSSVRKNRSVHSFVDKKTGEVYKSAGWKAPAKGVRYDLRLIKDREWLLENADWAGGYLYK
jgi:hypothetical protein